MKLLFTFFTATFVGFFSHVICAQMKMHQTGNVTFGTLSLAGGLGDYIYIKNPASNMRSIYLEANYTNDWHHTITSQVNRNNALSYAVRMDNSDRFYVFGTGTIYAAGSYYTSDISLKENIEPLKNSMDKVLLLEGVSYNFNDAFYASDKSEPTLDRLGDYYKKGQIGFIAQDVEKVIPEVVITSESGVKGLAYQNITAILVEAFKEQNVRIDSLESLLSEMTTQSYFKSPVLENPGINIPVEFLYQNQPNPFTQETTIRYKITPSAEDNYSINLFSINGSSILILDLAHDTEQVTISASILKPGSYIYALIKNGSMIDSSILIVSQ